MNETTSMNAKNRYRQSLIRRDGI